VDKEQELLLKIEELQNQIKMLKERERFLLQREKFYIHDLQRAKSIQGNFLPSPIDTFPLVDFEYFYTQQFGVGGDFFDVYKIDEHCFGVYIADVSGAGVSGSLLTIFLQENFDKKEKSPARALANLRTKYQKLSLGEESYITIFSMVFDIKNKTFYFCNGGHNQRSLLKEQNSLLCISCSGQPIGNWNMQYEYADHFGTFEKGDKLVLFTDGFADMKNVKGEHYGERLAEAVMKSPSGLREMLNFIANDFVSFCGKEKLTDDFTLLVLDIL